MVFFREALPNPAGEDTAGEWIKLANTSDESVDLSGWTVSDAGGKSYTLGTEAPPHSELVLEYSLTGITPNNGGETLTLTNNEGIVVDTLTYTEAGDDEIIVAERFIESEEVEEETDVEDPVASGGDSSLYGAGASGNVQVEGN